MYIINLTYITCPIVHPGMMLQISHSRRKSTVFGEARFWFCQNFT